jgi:hypothetical protein
MLKKDSLFTGLLAGIALPALAWMFFGWLFPNAVILSKPLIPYIIAIALNLFLIRVCYTKDAGKTGTGVMVVTFIVTLLVFIIKLKPGS